MKILIADVHGFVAETIASMIDNGDNDTVDNYEEGIELYKNNKYDIVIIDFASKDGSKLLKEILEIDKKQRIITLSSTLSCSEELGCEYCKEHLNKRRLLKHLSKDELNNLVKNFDTTECPYYNKFPPK